MAAVLPDTSLPWAIEMEGVYEIATSESLRLAAYRCPAGVWTIGWGETSNVKPGDTCTKEEADRWLCEDIAERADAVKAMCTNPPGGYELAALVSLAYNIGLERLKTSTVLRQHNAGNHAAASRAFGLWNKAKNPQTGELRELGGLTARRHREGALYLKADQNEPMPQAVEAESSLARSPIATSATVAAGAGVVEVISSAGQDIGAVKPALEMARDVLVNVLGVPTQWILPAIVIGAGLVILQWRVKQRRDGRA